MSENSIRPVTVGRKNWLFSDTLEGAQANTLYLTIVEMAKAYNLNLYEYLNFLFEQRPIKEMSNDELEKLAPWNEGVKELCSMKQSKTLALPDSQCEIRNSHCKCSTVDAPTIISCSTERLYFCIISCILQETVYTDQTEHTAWRFSA